MSPTEVATKMMNHKADSPEEWLSYLEDCGFRLSATEEEPEHGEETEEDPAEKPEKPEGENPFMAAPRPPLPAARLNAAKKALKGSK